MLSAVGVEDRFKIQELIGQGCFGSIHVGLDTKGGEKVAVKLESKNCDAPGSLKNEHTLMAQLALPTPQQGFAEVFFGGKVGSFYCVVMTLLGKSLADCRDLCPNKKLSIGSAAMIAQQAFQRIEYLHSKCIVHRDIKPENFMMGSGTKVHHLYIIDFGLSCPYMKGIKHVAMKSETDLVGTARYASINAHRLCTQSRRDDLEAICYMMIWCLRGNLPWSGLKVQDTVKKYEKIGEMKHDTEPGVLCKDMPEAFAKLLAYARSLDFVERPDYEKMQLMLNKVRKDNCPEVADHGFDWLKEGDVPEDLVPLTHWEPMLQPDDIPALDMKRASRFRFRNTLASRRGTAYRAAATVVGGTE